MKRIKASLVAVTSGVMAYQVGGCSLMDIGDLLGGVVGM